MRRTQTVSAAAVGAIYGGHLCAFGSVIAGSALGAGAVLGVSAIAGWVCGRWRGAGGAVVLAGLGVALGAAVSSSAVGVSVTVAGCAALGATLRVGLRTAAPREAQNQRLCDGPFRVDSADRGAGAWRSRADVCVCRCLRQGVRAAL